MLEVRTCHSVTVLDCIFPGSAAHFLAFMKLPRLVFATRQLRHANYKLNNEKHFPLNLVGGSSMAMRVI